VVRHRVADGFAPDGVVVDGIPAGTIHDGGRLAFGPEGYLYVTTGDAGDGERAQDRESLAGKVLRVTPDGDAHPDNPDGGDPRVFTYGHRNPQGLAWLNGTLVASEHGPDHDDEINMLRASENYGWPEVMGPSDDESYADPLTSYTPTIAPGSAAVYEGPIDDWHGDLFVGTLAGRHLRRIRIEDGSVVDQERLLDEEYGRLRTAFTGPDDHLYVTTSNQDGRGTPAPQDDRVLRIQPV
jgi:glucose/arabinose dehydrogenase